MKKFIFRFTVVVLSALMFTACSGKKADNTPDTPDDPAIEQPFQEITESDFKKVIIPLDHSNERPLEIEVESIDLSGLDFGAKLPPCKSPENRDNFVPEYYLHCKEMLESGEVEEDFREHYEIEVNCYEESLTTPQEGWLQGSFYDGNAVYISVSFDTECSINNHEWAVFRYISESGELTEVYTYSDTADTGRRYLIGGSGNTLFFIENIESDDTKIIARSIETGEENVIYRTEKYIEIIKADNSGLIFRDYDTETLSVAEGGGNRMVNNNAYDPNFVESVWEYNAETGECTELMSAGFIKENRVKDYSYFELPARTEISPENRKIDIITEKYRIRTDTTSGQIVCASEDYAMLYTSAAKQLHTYDLKKTEHYVTDFSEVAIEPYVYHNGIMFVKNSHGGDYTEIKQFIPELGMIIGFDKFDKYMGGRLGSEGGELYISSYDEIYIPKMGES